MISGRSLSRILTLAILLLTVQARAQGEHDTVRIKKNLGYILAEVPSITIEDSLLNDAILLSKRARRSAWEVRLLNFWSQQKIIANKFKDADSLISIALRFSERNEQSVPSIDYRDALFQKANVKFYLQQWDTCLQVVKTLQALSRNAQDRFNESISITNEANIYAITREQNSSYIDSLFLKARQVAKATSTLHDDVMMLHNYAAWLKSAPHYDLEQSRNVLLEIQDIARDAELTGYHIPPYSRAPFFFRGTHRLMLMELANDFFYLGNFEQATRYVDEVIHENRNRRFSSYNIFYKAYIETYRGNVQVVDSLLQWGLKRHDEYFTTTPNSPSYYYCLGWLAEQKNMYADAARNYEYAMDKGNFQTFGNDAWDQVNEHHLALFRTYIKAGNKKQADSLFSQISARMAQNITPYFRIYFLKEIPAYHVLNGNAREALKASIAYYQLKDSLTGMSNYAIASQHEKQFQLKEKNRMLALARKENELKQDQLVLKQNQSLMMGVGLIASFGLLLLVYFNYRFKKNLAVKLKLKNDQVETLIQELHHRVKNNLQVVTGLLSMQSNRTENESARQAMEEGKRRVEAMAMIHQKLLRDSAYTMVNMREYVVTLCDSIAETYGHDPESIMVYDGTHSATVEVNIEKAVPVGLIVNEIVTNAFKHAFRETSKPRISVSLIHEGGTLNIQISDNGTGIQYPLKNTSSTGTHLVKVLVKQLDATMTIENKNGTLYSIKIPMNE